MTTNVAAPPLPVSNDGWVFRPVEPDLVGSGASADVDSVHRWMHEPHVERWWHEAWPREKWSIYLRDIRAMAQYAQYMMPVLAVANREDERGAIAFVQTYRVLRDSLGRYYEYDEHDLGVHIAIGDEQNTNRKLGRSILRAVSQGLLDADPRCRRVVAEPDERNTMAIRAFEAAGFQTVHHVALAEKRAALMVYPRTPADAVLRLKPQPRPQPQPETS